MILYSLKILLLKILWLKIWEDQKLKKSIKNIKRMMEKEAKKENFMQAAILRDELFRYKKLLFEKFDD